MIGTIRRSTPAERFDPPSYEFGRLHGRRNRNRPRPGWGAAVGWGWVETSQAFPGKSWRSGMPESSSSSGPSSRCGGWSCHDLRPLPRSCARAGATGRANGATDDRAGRAGHCAADGCASKATGNATGTAPLPRAFGRFTGHRATGCPDRAADDRTGRATDGHPDGRSAKAPAPAPMASLPPRPWSRGRHFRFRPRLVAASRDRAPLSQSSFRNHRTPPFRAHRRSRMAPVPSTPDGVDLSTVRRDSTRRPINSGRGSNRRVTAWRLRGRRRRLSRERTGRASPVDVELAMAATAFSAGIAPQRASSTSVAAATCGGSISNSARRSRESHSVRSHPSRGTCIRGSQRETMSGRAFSQSVAAMNRPASGPRTVETYGTRGVSAGWRRFQRRRERVAAQQRNEGTEKTSAAIPKRSARRAWAATAWAGSSPTPAALPGEPSGRGRAPRAADRCPG